MELVEQCIAQEPDQIEVYSTKSRVLKHAGDLEGAAAAAYKAQSLDGADRWLLPSSLDGTPWPRKQSGILRIPSSSSEIGRRMAVFEDSLAFA